MYSDHVKRDLVVTFKGESVGSLWLTTITITNAGNIDLIAEDFFVPLEIEVEDARVLQADVDPACSCASTVSLQQAPTGKLTLRVSLLNPQDTAAISLLTDDEPSLSIGGRIRGVRDIKKAISPSARSDREMVSFVVGIFVLEIGVVVTKDRSLFASRIFEVLLATFVGFSLWLTIRNRKRRKL